MSRSRIRLIASREVSTRLRDRGFIISSLFLVLIVVAGAVVGALLGGDEEERTVGLVGERSRALGQEVVSAGAPLGLDVRLRTVADEPAARTALEDGDLDLAIVDGSRLLVHEELDPALGSVVQATAARLRQEGTLRSAGLPPERVAQVLRPEPLPVRALDPDPGGATNRQLGFVAVPLLFISVFVYGLWIATGVVEEKSSRVVEVVLSAARPSELLAGKTIGIGLLGLGQLAVVGAVGLLAAAIAGLGLPSGAIGVLAAVLVWFLLGFALYGAAFAMAGALVSRQEDLQHSTVPVSTLLFVAYGFTFAVAGDLGGTGARIASLLPPVAPMLMPVRIAAGEAAVWEIVLSGLITLAAVIALVRLAARVYERAVLRFGGRVKLREALRGA